MEKLTILRMFFYFPLFGLLLPDVGVLISRVPGRVPMEHLAIEMALVICILICTAAISYGKKRIQRHDDEANEAFYS